MNKTMTFAVVHFTVAFSVAYALTGSVLIGGTIALIEPTINTVAYHLHERIWQRVEARRARPGARGAQHLTPARALPA